MNTKQIIKKGKKTFKMFVPEDDGSATDWLDTYSNDLVEAVRKDERERINKKIREICIQEQCIEIEKTRPKAMDMSIPEYAESLGKSYMAMKLMDDLTYNPYL